MEDGKATAATFNDVWYFLLGALVGGGAGVGLVIVVAIPALAGRFFLMATRREAQPLGDLDGPALKRHSCICECAGVPSGAVVRVAPVLFVCDSIPA